jgi:cytidylate kinase
MKLGEFGVGKITKQNATKDAPIGSEYSNVKKLGLGSGKPKIHNKKATKNSDPNTLFNLGITESVDAASLKPFVKFCIKSLKLKSVPKIVITKKKLDGTFGYYDTDAKTLTVSLNDRHQADVMRTLAHELVHLAQDEQNQDIDGSDGSKHENQANAIAGVIMRKWAGKDPSLFENAVTPMLYHATYKPFLNSIMKNGLGGSGAQTQWEDSKPGYVYLAKDPVVAVSHAEANEEVPDEYIDDIVVLSIDASQLDQDNLENDPNVMDDDSTLAYKGIIPSNAFSVQIDELKIEKPDPKDTLGVKRKDMPQVKSDDYAEFIEYLKKNGATFTKETIPARDLKAMQKEFSDEGIMKQLMKNIEQGPNRKAVIASSDDYIMDGHHRWLVAINTGRDLNVFRVNLPAYELYDLVNKFEKTYYKDIYNERGSIGVPLASGLVMSLFPHRPLKIAKSTPGKLRYDETITTVDLDQLETFADKLFAKVGIDVEFTRHFLDRVNDERNRKPITMAELTRLFKQEFKRWAKPIAQMGPGQEAVMKDLQTDINLPFALQYDKDNNELDLIAKTVMRKKDFRTPDREFPVEGWSAKYKKSINCSNPKGFSQKAHCAGKKKNEEAPPGREDQVKKLKKKFDDPGAPYAIAWAQHNKHGKPTKEDDSSDTLGSRINFPGFEKKDKPKPKYKPVPKQDKSVLDKVKSWFTDDINEGYVLRLENDEDLLVLHIRDTKSGERAEVRGNPNYEIDYDENDELHQLLDVIGKASNISDLMNGKIVNINPKHPDGPKSYAAIEKAMDEDVDLEEGVNDPHIFKAVFLAGGPGSGKSFVAKNILGGTGLRSINSDEVYEYLMKKQGLSLDPETIFSPQGQEIRDKAKGLARQREATYLDGRIGLIIDGTGKDVSKYQVMAQKLRAIGYDVSMIYVNTSLEVAQQRNKQRERSIKPAEVEKMWNNVQQNLMQFQQIFGAGRFHIIDNSGGLEDLDRQKNFDKVYVETQRFLNTPPKNRKALAWIQKQKEQNDGQRSAQQPTNQEPDGGTTATN